MKIGIDLGTSFSSIAAEINGKIEMIKIATGASAFGDSFSMPTAVYVDNGQVLVGQAALGKRKISPSCFKCEFKRDLGTTTPYILSGEEYLPEQLYTEIFLYFKEQAVKQAGEKIERVYLTHPANYGNNKKRLIEKAANNAGFFDIVLVDEPTAAAAGYSQKNKIIDGDILLVYDLGGGTFDTALIKKTSKGYMHLTEPLGISQCGGVDFDRAIFDDIINKMNKDDSIDVERLIREKRFTTALSEICIQIKHQLSQAQSHTEPIAAGYDYFEYRIVRQEFEDMISPFVANTCEKVKDIIKNSGLSISDIDKVLLVGGCSRIPLVQKMVAETLKKEICFDADPELAVCQGALSLDNLKLPEVIGIVNNKLSQPVIILNNSENLNGSSAKIPMDKFLDAWADTKEQKPKGNLPFRDIRIIENNELMRKIMSDLMLGLITADNDWIYYLDYKSNLNKIKKDGTRMMKLSYCSAAYPLKVEGEWIYYRVKEKENKCCFYRIKKDGTQETCINREYSILVEDKYALRNGWIYFANAEGYLKKMRTDGSGITTLGDSTNVRQVVLDKDWIYYINYSYDFTTRSLYRIGLDGTNKTVICMYSAMLKIDVSNGWIYYKSSNYREKGLWKIRADGTGNCQVCDCDLNVFNIIGDRIYYSAYYNDGSLSELKLFNSNIDGSSFEIFNF